ENERREKRKEFLSPEEYMKHSGEEYKWRMVVFRNPVWGKKSDNIKIIRKNLEAMGGPSLGEMDTFRFLNCFVRPVYRDASGHYVSKKDRENDAYNKELLKTLTREYKFNENGGMEEPDLSEFKDKLIEIGRSYVKDVLLKLPQLSAPDRTSDEDLLRSTEKFETVRIHELNTLSNIVSIDRETGKVKNDKIPALGQGLEELSNKYPDLFEQLKARLNSKEANFMETLYLLKGYKYVKPNTESSFEEPEKLYAQHATLKSAEAQFRQDWKDGYDRWIKARSMHG
ncbi:MAG: hypothetical protein K5989_09650, partial [Lachnospiraceae bacterium]|nr:hypothetical protein [Lachnospiraceae bacterium]